MKRSSNCLLFSSFASPFEQPVHMWFCYQLFSCSWLGYLSIRLWQMWQNHKWGWRMRLFFKKRKGQRNSLICIWFLRKCRKNVAWLADNRIDSKFKNILLWIYAILNACLTWVIFKNLLWLLHWCTFLWRK